MIVLITGNKGSGKDTMADYLVKKYEFTKYAFARPIKEAIKIIFDWSDNDLNKGELKEKKDNKYGISPRDILQWFGTEVFQYYINKDFPEFEKKIGRGIWVNSFLNWRNKYKYLKNIVISDWRFPHEQEIILNNIKDEKIKFIKVIRNIENIDTHESEIHIRDLFADITLNNTTTISDFHEDIDKIFQK
jgi:hypothetical protein